jgi:ketosteroid isomerase-like protein
MAVINIREIIVEWVRAVNEADDQAILALTTPDFKSRVMFTGPDWHPPEFSRAELAEAVVSMKAMFFKYPLVITIRSILVDGDRASFEATSDTETINGKPYKNRYHFALEFEGNKISEAREYCCSYLIANVLSEFIPSGEPV